MGDDGDRSVSGDDTSTDLRARIAGLSPARRALLEQRLRARALGASDAAAPPVGPDANDAVAPLSFGQRRLQMLHRIAPESTAYTVAWAIRLHGALDAERLMRALRAVVARHAVLRTTYEVPAAPADGEEPRQRVHAPGELPLPLLVTVLPMPDGDAPAPDAQLRAALADFAARPFRLDTDGPIRATLFRVSEAEHVLALAVHHIACDGWSLHVIHRDLAVAYAQATDAPPEDGPPVPHLPAPATTYAAYARQQHALAAADALAAERRYWAAQLMDPPPAWELPRGHPRPAHRTWQEGRAACTLSPEVTRAVRALARSRKTTLFVTLLAAFQATLARWMDLDDVIVGVPEDGRDRRELEDVVGFFVNTLAIRARFDDGDTFLDDLDATRQAMLDALEHRRLPIEQAVELARPTRSSSHTPLFQALFALESRESQALHLPGIQARPVAMPPRETKTDLTLHVIDAGETLELELAYAADYVTPVLATRLVHAVAAVAEHAVTAPGTPIAQLALLPAAARAAELARGIGTTPVGWHARTVPELVRLQAERRATAVAVHVAHADGSRPDALTYAELHAAGDRLARRLRGMGVGRGHRVALLMDRSPLAVAAMLGVVASGAAYVPLDPAHPQRRLAEVLADAGPTALLADPTHAAEAQALLSGAEVGDLAAAASLVVMNAADLHAAPDEETASAPAADVSPDDIACVIYTSGSTGTPKGVAVRHEGIHSLVVSNDAFPLDARTVMGQTATLAFDAATFEVWGALANGGRLAIVPLETLLTPVMLGEALRANDVDTLFLTTALFNQIARTRPGTLAPLRTVIFGGEAADVHAVRDVRSALPSLRLVNGYGPTETTTFACVHVVDEVPPDATSVPIGRPLSRVRLHVLDDALQPVPGGAVGELCIGGAGVAAGYLGQPALTAGRFVRGPDAVGGERLYRTGDRCRWREDGTLEFLARRDGQVKIRGFRVEPREVERVLLRHPDVAEVVVLTRRGGADAAASLVACVVPRSDAPPDGASAHRSSLAPLRDWILEHLPPAFVPAVFVPLARFPVTSNGKVDRAALARLADAATEMERTLEAASATDVRQEAPGDPELPEVAELRAIWAEVLGVPVRAHDDFFHLGGHSLLALQLLDRVERRLGVRLPASVLLEARTVTALAARLRGETSSTPRDAASPRDGRNGLFFFLHGDLLGGGLYCAELARDWTSRHPFHAVASGSPSEGRTVEDLAREHVAMLRSVQPSGPYRLGGFCHGGVLAYEMARQLEDDGETVAFLFIIDVPSLNTHLRWLHRAAGALGAMLGWSEEERRGRFVAWRTAQRDRLTMLVSWSPLAAARHFAARAPRVLWRSLRRPRGDAAPLEAPASRAPTGSALDDFRVMDALYRGVLAAYVPGRYRGAMTLGISSDTLAEQGARLAVDGWRRLVAGGLTVVEVPGSHATMRSGAGAQRMRQVLDEALAAPPSSGGAT